MWERRRSDGPTDVGHAGAYFGDGRAADRIVEALRASGHANALPSSTGEQTTALRVVEESRC